MHTHPHFALNNDYVLYLTLAMIAATFIIRFAVIGMAGRFTMSERFKKTLRFVPVTVLPAIIAVEILGKGSNFAFNLENPKVLAAINCLYHYQSTFWSYLGSYWWSSFINFIPNIP